MIGVQKPNIKIPSEFKEKLQDVMKGIYELFELAKEYNLSPVSENGVIRYCDRKTCFQVSRQYERPSEFLQAFLDIIRVNYEPAILGTFFLNSNMCFLYDGIPETSFQLAYASITSKQDKKFEAFWTEDVIPHIKECGYAIESASAVYAVVSTGKERYDIDFAVEVSNMLNSGFSLDEAICLLKASILKNESQPIKEAYAGYCLDPALGRAIRVSLWGFMKDHDCILQ